jgi:short subunit dehydrogenase-like uncharacterized protein
MRQTTYDVVLYGASGFVGQQTVKYFAERTQPSEVRWAIAGRDRQKLESVMAQVGVNVDILIADSQDRAAIDAIVSQTRVVLNTAGPFGIYGDEIVAACVLHGTHYVDITGETPWVRDLIDRHHIQAAADGTRIIPCCGFDSVPSDLGAYLVARYLQQERGVECRQVKAYYQAAGGFNGGTLASGLDIYDRGQWARVANPFLLNPPESVPVDVERHRDPVTPQFDRDVDAWTAPFFMGPVNTRIVRRSWALFDRVASLEENREQESDGADFSYQEYLKCDPPWGWLQAAGMVGGMALIAGALQVPPLRALLLQGMPQPGTGPTKQVMDGGWFRCELLGWGRDGSRVRGLIADAGDPGNRATVKFICESALCLVLDFDRLPGGVERGGVLTPATGLGDVLVERLRDAGMQIEVEGVC